MLTIAKTMAVKSLQISADNDLRSLLAYQGFLFNERYNGYSNDVDIYTGLYKALKISLSNSYNVFNGHESEVRSVVFIPGSHLFLVQEVTEISFDGTYTTLRKNIAHFIKATA